MKHKLLILLLSEIIVVSLFSCKHRRFEFAKNERITFIEKSRVNDFDFYYIKFGNILSKDSIIEIMCNNYIDGLGYTNVISKKVFFKHSEVKQYCLLKDSVMLTAFDQYLVKNERGNFQKLSEQEINAISKLFDYFPEFAKQYRMNSLEIKNYLGWYETKN